MEIKFNYFKIGLMIFIVFCIILTIFFILLKEPDYLQKYNKELVIKKSSEIKDSGVYQKKIFGDREIIINTDNFICYNLSNFSQYNSEKAKFILGHEFLHYLDYKYKISQFDNIQCFRCLGNYGKNKYHELLAKTEPIHLLQYVDTSITLLSEYKGTREQNKEAYVRFVNYCYYARNNNVNVAVCQSQDLEFEYIQLDNFLHSELIQDFIGNICED